MIAASNPFWAVLFFVLAVFPLVCVHELGHYLVGRWFGVKAEVFSIGFGRALWKRADRRGTCWQIGWLPLGGYVRFAGDMSPASQGNDEWLKLPAEERNRTFQSKPVWQRALIVLAGPLTNFAFAMIVFGALMSWFGEPRIGTAVGGFAPHSAAQAAGMRVGDRIVSIDGHAVSRFEDLALTTQVSAGQPLHFVVDRAGAMLPLTVTPRLVSEREVGGGQVKIGQIGVQGRITFQRLSPAEIPGAAVRFTLNSVRTMIVVLRQVVMGERSVKQLGGPVKMAAVSGEVAAMGPLDFVQFVAMVSINLGFINLLPIPMLDGGHLVFYAVEAARRRPVSQRAQDWAFRSGLALLLAFMTLVTVNDLTGLGLFRRLAGLIG